MNKKELFIASVKDSVIELVYYDRKHDEELSPEDVAQLFDSDEVTIEEVVEVFEKELMDQLGYEYEKDNEEC